MNQEIEELYQEIILDHFKNPRCNGCLHDANAKVEVLNPLCGDQICLTIKADTDKISAINFCGKGCSISQASASMMTEICQNKSIAEAKSILADFKAYLQTGDHSADFEDRAGDLKALAGVKKFAARIRCALLAWEALRQALEKLESHEKPAQQELVTIE